MNNNENLEKICEKVVSGGGTLTTKELNELGFTSKNLKELVDNNILERVKIGNYRLISDDILFEYGQKLYTQNDFETAILAFEECLKLNNSIKIYLMIFLCLIKLKDYERAFTIYDTLVEQKCSSYDTNLYLYLLNLITDIPEKYREFVKNLTFNDCQAPENNIEQSRIIDAIFKKRLGFSIKRLRSLRANSSKISINSTILLELLNQAADSETINRNKVLTLANERKYQEIIDYLTEREKRISLNDVEEIIIVLAGKALELEENRIIPEITTLGSTSVFSAIKVNDFETALNLNASYNQSHRIDSSTSTISVILNQICKLIKELSKPPVETPEEPAVIEEPVEKPISVPEEEQPINTLEATNTFTSIISSLLQKNSDSALNSLHKYLELINHSEYEFIITNLIKISLTEKDANFAKPVIALTLIGASTFTFDISSYIKDFYKSISNRNFEGARIYLDILEDAPKLNQECAILPSLYQVLEIYEENAKRNPVVVPEVSIPHEDNIVEEIPEPAPAQDIPDAEPEQPSFSQKELSASNQTPVKTPKKPQYEDDNEAFIADKYEELCAQKGIILLRPMPKGRRAIIHEIVETYPNMVSFSIGEEDNRQVVLRYKDFKRINIKELVKDAQYAYNNKKYDESLELYSYLLEVLKEPKSFVYAKLGFLYLKKGYKNTAISYLTVANYLAKKEPKSKFDCTTLLMTLKGEISPDEEIKPNFKMTQTDFDYSDTTDYYGVNNFSEINDYITSSGLDVETACQSLNISEEEIDIIKLIYAREFYMRGDLTKGDEFLKAVEKRRNRSKAVSKILNEIRTNRRFYQNRAGDSSGNLVLSLRPNK